MEIYGMTGERLGTIGQEDAAPDKLPAWVRALSSKPSVSVRQGIAWGYNQPYEDTDTLVLTAASGKFIDIRLPRTLQSPSELLLHPSFWAFSGISTTTFYNGTQPSTHTTLMPYTAHCVFVHELDSRGPGLQDEGDMFLLPNNDCVEVGSMLNPASGQVQMYKEYWTAAPRRVVEQQSEGSRCIVAEIRGHAGTPVRGIMIAYNGYIQALVRDIKRENIDQLAFARYQLASSGWERDERSVTHLPVDWITADGRAIGDEHAAPVQHFKWQVVEVNDC